MKGIRNKLTKGRETMYHLISFLKKEIRKKTVLCGLSVISIILATQALAKVCFISDENCNGDFFSTEVKCDQASLTHQWKKLKCFKYSSKAACNDDRGNYYSIEACASGYLNLDQDHYCLEDMECSNSSFHCCKQCKQRCKGTDHGGNWRFCASDERGLGKSCEDDETKTRGRPKYQTCDKICSGYPLNNQLSNANCTSCSNSSGMHYNCTCHNGYVLKNGYCEKKIDCSAYPLTSTWSGGASCTQCTDNDGRTTYKCSCNSGYENKGNRCDPVPQESGKDYSPKDVSGCPVVYKGTGENLGNDCGNYSCYTGYRFCCDDMSHPICNKYARPCYELPSNCSLVTHVQCGGVYNGYSIRFCPGLDGNLWTR